MTEIRHPAVAGTFYPAEPGALARQLAQFMSEAGNAAPLSALPKAIIGPHAGYVYSGPVAARAYARLTAARGKISRVVLIGPSHYVGFRGLAVDTAEAWAMPTGTVALDTEAITRLRALPMVGELEAAYQREHALEVHVPFLQHVLGEFRLVPIVAGDAPPDAVAAVFNALWGGPETLIVVSTDLSHYLDYAACRRLDQSTAEAIERFDIDALDPSAACGRVPARGLLLAARQRGMTIERLDLRNSGDTAGPRDRVVGYGAWALYEAAPPDAERAAVEAVGPALLELARRSIRFGLDTGQAPHVIANAGLPPLLAAHGAAFVTLRRRGELRGCIGSATAYRPLATDVVQHAFDAAYRDWRFPRLEWLELAGLSAVGLGADPARADALRQRDRPAGAAAPRGRRCDDRGPGASCTVPAQRVGGGAGPAAVPDPSEAEGRAGGGAFLGGLPRAAVPLDRGQREDGCGAGSRCDAFRVDRPGVRKGQPPIDR